MTFEGNAEQPETTTAPEASAPEASETTSEGTDEGGELEAQEYTPDYKFKAYGKDAEMDEWVRGFIKDKETEERFRSLYAKSHAFEPLKERYTAREEEWKGKESEYSTKLSEHDQAWEELKYYRDNDLDSFFKTCHLDPKKVIDWVERHLEYTSLPPEKQKEWDSARESTRKAYALERENQRLQSERQQSVVESHQSAFWEYMEHPDVSDFASRYDEKIGSEGAFAQAVIEYGEAQELKTGKTVEPLEAIRAVYKKFKPFVGAAGQTRQEAGREQQLREPAVSERGSNRPPVIPTIKSGDSAVSPTKKVFKSLDDLKKHAKDMANRE